MAFYPDNTTSFMYAIYVISLEWITICSAYDQIILSVTLVNHAK
ncbi:conserved hypothetical protein [Xenorhabdus bovienii str. Jollieti]|nr:conserved hypothetical protein [Xenorhabdus bovienii str. Jollieti]